MLESGTVPLRNVNIQNLILVPASQLHPTLRIRFELPIPEKVLKSTFNLTLNLQENKSNFGWERRQLTQVGPGVRRPQVLDPQAPVGRVAEGRGHPVVQGVGRIPNCQDIQSLR